MSADDWWIVLVALVVVVGIPLMITTWLFLPFLLYWIT